MKRYIVKVRTSRGWLVGCLSSFKLRTRAWRFFCSTHAFVINEMHWCDWVGVPITRTLTLSVYPDIIAERHVSKQIITWTV